MYEVVTCVSCGARIEVPEGEIDSGVGAAHLSACPNRDPYRFVPAWSIGWPYYWTAEEDKRFTLDVAWMSHTSLTDVPLGIQYGGMPKTWHPFAPKVQAEIVLGEDA